MTEKLTVTSVLSRLMQSEIDIGLKALQLSGLHIHLCTTYLHHTGTNKAPKKSIYDARRWDVQNVIL